MTTVFCPVTNCKFNNREGREWWEKGICKKKDVELEGDNHDPTYDTNIAYSLNCGDWEKR